MSMNMEKDTCETTANGLDGDMSAERAQNARGTALRLFKKLMAQRGKLLIILFSIIIGSAFNILSPKGIGIAVNEIFTGVQNAIAKGETFQVNLETMGAVLLGLLGLYLLTSLFSYIQQNTMASVSQTLTLTLRKEISAKLNRLPLRYFDRHKKGEVLSRATSDLEKVADTLQESLFGHQSLQFGAVDGGKHQGTQRKPVPREQKGNVYELYDQSDHPAHQPIWLRGRRGWRRHSRNPGNHFHRRHPGVYPVCQPGVGAGNADFYTVNALQGAIAAAERVFQLLDEEEEAPNAANPAMLTAPQGQRLL